MAEFFSKVAEDPMGWFTLFCLAAAVLGVQGYCRLFEIWLRDQVGE